MTLGIHRSDYMLHCDGNQAPAVLQQVEINTVAASFSSLSALVSQLHRYLANRTHFYNDADPTTMDILSENLPVNQSLTAIADALATAHKLSASPKQYAFAIKLIVNLN